MKLRIKKKTAKDIEKEKKEKQKRAANVRRRKADNLRRNSGLKMKKVHLHQETLTDLKTLAKQHGFVTSDDELGYDDLSCLITLFADYLLNNNSFEAIDYETIMLKRLHLTVKYCQYEDDSLVAMDEYEISELLQNYNYTLQEETIKLLLGREASESDFDWSDDIINALSDEEKVKSTIDALT
ncbi:hypothetical protein BIT28_26650 [Photobacterium proteolyticum]|uniref:Uncharacterized protein n=1 Tax=Photobacterium proteolyticum TaxID=1903952 RepID=A0A1Q9GUU3_9GAMM|nr:hypothetical protein [Photobacterium proteolyticum]OLQ78896.1 hypothetical protein BIT28_26650 [Photobacterium proteolyticum]